MKVKSVWTVYYYFIFIRLGLDSVLLGTTKEVSKAFSVVQLLEQEITKEILLKPLGY